MRSGFLLCALICLSSAHAKLVRIDVEQRSDVLAGRAFGKSGPYECIRARAYFAVDPKHPLNRGIVDIAKAAVNDAGQVEFSADLFMLKPRDSAKGNGTVLLEPPNRGGKALLATFNRGKAAIDPADPASFGDGLLLNEGYTLVWLGWQHDVPTGKALMRLFAPVAVDVEGLVRSEFTADRAVMQFSLGDAGHVPYPVADPGRVTITERDSIYGTRREIPVGEWSLENATAVRLNRPTVPGHIYEVVYAAKNPVIAGLGLAGIRDVVSFLKFGDASGSIRRAIGLGTSQSAMALRALLMQGFNEDESGRKVFDGIFSNVAGARRSTFQRFTQPSRTAGPMRNASYSTTDQFPFSDANSSTAVPKIFYTNSAYEYWGSGGSLIHTTVDGTADVPLPANARLYVFASGQHGPAAFPPRKTSGQNLPNFNDYRWVMRALLTKLNSWIAEGAEPPPSVYPLIRDRTLVPVAAYAFPAIPQVQKPDHAHHPVRLDFGSRYKTEGVAAKEPPVVTGPAYETLVPQCDKDGNDFAGIRTPEIAVPLGSFVGWNLRNPSVGAPAELLGNTGSFIPFALTKESREKNGDPRPSIQERYANIEAYIPAVREAALDLARRGFLLPADSDSVVRAARRYWQWAHTSID